jgi:hypothetical protein
MMGVRTSVTMYMQSTTPTSTSDDPRGVLPSRTASSRLPAASTVSACAHGGEDRVHVFTRSYCRRCSRRARGAPYRSGTAGALSWRGPGRARLYLPIDPVETLGDRDKVQLLEEIDREARSLDSRITQVMASLAASHDTILVLASDGTLAADVRPLVRLNGVIIEHQGRRDSTGHGALAYGEFPGAGAAGALHGA